MSILSLVLLFFLVLYVTHLAVFILSAMATKSGTVTVTRIIVVAILTVAFVLSVTGVDGFV